MATEKITDADFDTAINSDTPVLVDFWAEWCGPCRAIGPKLEELSDEFSGKAKILKMNVDENQATPARFGVRSIPTLLIFKSGNVVDQIVGNVEKDAIAAKLNSQL
ncbi:MAG: thioredoxin [Bdellovibrionota bacterium]|nr:thioredoxin [Pseudobdellovibrionaceae bacterium]MEC9281202.1 thioredoxin [Bdellovibrionota bacterium]|tara:strand:+ start:72681 stop:72998 length:318 start_codon:yes stop_codon:yes gene_type:complete